jgi:hypothetical protein
MTREGACPSVAATNLQNQTELFEVLVFEVFPVV